MNDPLADLLTSVGDEIGQCICDGCNAEHAEWLRANRSRVLEALGGREGIQRLVTPVRTQTWTFLTPEDEEHDE